MSTPETNVHTAEIAKFDALAATWWDRDGASRTLHDINACRVDFIAARATLSNSRVLDVGCGGGILTEALAARGAVLTGIDAAQEVIAVARSHATGAGLIIDYEVATAEAYATRSPACFDVIVCMELIEHVPDPHSLIRACAQLCKPGGDCFVSTLDRTPRAYLAAVLGAEYLLRLLPIGTHDYMSFIRPAELAAMLRGNDCELREVRGMRYNPLTRRGHLTVSPRANYLVHARRR
ncbi:MAG: bifunctional 2-polyprenyl-6-hydroxyphenol methylase/3-demethylubiquinol 3-O-methyltransferase UbiG [Gammaproteobacteria bacterium]